MALDLLEVGDAPESLFTLLLKQLQRKSQENENTKLNISTSTMSFDSLIIKCYHEMSLINLVGNLIDVIIEKFITNMPML